MKRLAFLLVCLPFLMNAQETKGIKFVQGLSWQQVLEKSKAENKYVFVDVFATWCAPCKEMDKNVYENDYVAGFFNDKIISVKVQMDSTKEDSEWIKSWYADAHKMAREYKVEGYPTFLFFTPDGILAHKDLGYKNVRDFVKLVGDATHPDRVLRYAELEDYKKGKKDYKSLDELAIFVSDIIGRRALADSIAKDYKENFLDKLNKDSIITKENVDFMARFSSLITSKDHFFKLCYYRPESADEIRNQKDWARYIVDQTITREELDEKLVKDRKPVSKRRPDWEKIRSTINKKYEKANADKLVLDYQITYHRFYDVNWQQWAIYKNQRIKKYPPDPKNGLALSMELNDGGAWDAFLRCNDKTALAQALNWIDLAIKLTESKPHIAFLDTRASVLYKLGRVKEAIAQEEKAVEIALGFSQQEGTNVEALLRAVNEYKEVIEKMKKGQPTYLEQGAVWDANTLPKRQL